MLERETTSYIGETVSPRDLYILQVQSDPIDEFNAPLKDLAELKRTNEYFINNSSLTGLRDPSAHTSGIFSLLRSDNQRSLELADLFLHEYERDGKPVGTAMVQVLRGGKTSRNGSLQFGAFLRHLDVMVCPIAIHSMFLFARYVLATCKAD